MKLRSVRSSFFSMVCLKAVFAGGCLGVPLRVGLSVASPRYAVGFPLQSLTWVKGFSLSCAYTLAHGLSRPGVRCRPLRQAAWPKPDIGAEGQTEHVRPCRHTGLRLSPKLPVPPPVRKSSPVLVRKPEADSPPIYFSRTYVLALGNGRSRLSGRLLFPAPGK